MKQARVIQSLFSLKDYDEILITGGEPMLNPLRTLNIIKDIRALFPEKLIYLYTAYLKYPEMSDIPPILEAVDGMQFSLHENADYYDLMALEGLQNIIATMGKNNPEFWKKSFRLYIDSRIRRSALVQPYLWNRVEVKSWLTEEELKDYNKGSSGLPINEDLLVMWDAPGIRPYKEE